MYKMLRRPLRIAGPALALLLGACSTVTPPTDHQPEASFEPLAEPAPSPYNRVVAWVPKDRAPTRAAAAALVHVALGNAKTKAQAKLCHNSWVFAGKTVEAIGPLPADSPARLGHRPAWFYRLSWQPQADGCPGVSTRRFYRTMAGLLPRWMHMQVASAMQVAGRGLR
ncbi:MAG TPA: hypothetical protein VKA76_12050 [Gammaproteobacteria bacterium]|nr:hypothetical protein [Gammaproteobacteria bacterium]